MSLLLGLFWPQQHLSRYRSPWRGLLVSVLSRPVLGLPVAPWEAACPSSGCPEQPCVQQLCCRSPRSRHRHCLRTLVHHRLVLHVGSSPHLGSLRLYSACASPADVGEDAGDLCQSKDEQGLLRSHCPPGASVRPPPRPFLAPSVTHAGRGVFSDGSHSGQAVGAPCPSPWAPAACVTRPAVT